MLGLFFIVSCNMLKDIGWLAENGREICKIAESSTGFLFGEDLETILSLIKSMNHLKVHRWLRKHLKCRLKNLRLTKAWIAPKH